MASAIINRCGFNSEGIVAVAKRLGAQHGKRKFDETSSASSSSSDDIKHGGKAGPGILGVNLGKNKTSEDAAADYVQGVHTLSQYSDYLVDLLFVSLLVFFLSFSFSSVLSKFPFILLVLLLQLIHGGPSSTPPFSFMLFPFKALSVFHTYVRQEVENGVPT